MSRKKIPFMTILISVLLATTALADIPDTAHTDVSVPPDRENYVLSTVTSTPTTIYQPGRYIAGTDIPAGEYMLLRLPEAESCAYYIYDSKEPGTAGEPLEFCNFQYNVVLTLEPGQTLLLSGCTASPVNQVPQIDHREGQGYKVGIQIPAGTYRLAKTAGYQSAIYIGPRASTRRGNMTDYAFLTGDSYVTVAEGQYLLLVGCSLDEYLGNQDAPVDNLPLPASYQAAEAYQPGTYTAGIDLPPGDYILFVIPNRVQGQYSHFEIHDSIDHIESTDGLLDVGLVNSQVEISLKDGNALRMSNCIAFPVHP